MKVKNKPSHNSTAGYQNLPAVGIMPTMRIFSITNTNSSQRMSTFAIFMLERVETGASYRIKCLLVKAKSIYFITTCEWNGQEFTVIPCITAVFLHR